MVQRTVAVLERLTAHPEGATLTELSRAERISPSSLLALLTTLRARGYVTRGEADGRYRAGPALAALGSAAVAALNPLAAFVSVGASLAAETGETVLLWQVDGNDAVLVAAHEGQHELRVVPRIGERMRLDRSVVLATALAVLPETAVSVGKLPSGAWAAARAFTVPGAPAPMVLATAGPAERVQRAEIEGAVGRAAARLGGESEASNSRPRETVAWGPLGREELQAFLAQPLIASLAFLRDDGYPAAVPVRFQWDGGAFWLLPEPGAHWAAELDRHPHVSLTVSESGQPLRRANVQGLAAVVRDPARARSLESELRARYATAGVTSPTWPQQSPVAVQIQPTRLLTSRGLRGRRRARSSGAA